MKRTNHANLNLLPSAFFSSLIRIFVVHFWLFWFSTSTQLNHEWKCRYKYIWRSFFPDSLSGCVGFVLLANLIKRPSVLKEVELVLVFRAASFCKIVHVLYLVDFVILTGLLFEVQPLARSHRPVLEMVCGEGVLLCKDACVCLGVRFPLVKSTTNQRHRHTVQ